MTSDDMWTFATAAGYTPEVDLTGYKVEATDGPVGKVDKHSKEIGSQHLVVDTGVWIFGKEVLLPAGTVTTIDKQAETIHVARTREQIENAPEFDRHRHLDDLGYRNRIGGHYGPQG
ncbi:PRC-barrel domain containing protein [Streptomyces sp. t39]|uniref:PRC-barrel domain containing protein n=1 Tax=Streptomyces sp. t39 TaxID=1828156 RepID=UPI0011CE0FB7|nr:PRC-barrel domain containing protein [Streptomyces sp. t39]TXS52029.1 PRC-barrel domain containing protein [Streptomyces sp. t39]